MNTKNQLHLEKQNNKCNENSCSFSNDVRVNYIETINEKNNDKQDKVIIIYGQRI